MRRYTTEVAKASAVSSATTKTAPKRMKAGALTAAMARAKARKSMR